MKFPGRARICITGWELLQEILVLAGGEGKAVLFLDEANALSLEHLLPPPQAREASARLVASLCEKLDGLDDFAPVVVVASTIRTDSIDAALVAPGRLDRLIEVSLPEGPAQQEILQLVKARAEQAAGRTLFADLDYRSLLPPMGGMSGAEISEVVRLTLEQKVQAAERGAGDGGGDDPGCPAVDRRLPARSRRRREDPLRPVPLTGVRRATPRAPSRAGGRRPGTPAAHR